VRQDHRCDVSGQHSADWIETRYTQRIEMEQPCNGTERAVFVSANHGGLCSFKRSGNDNRIPYPLGPCNIDSPCSEVIDATSAEVTNSITLSRGPPLWSSGHTSWLQNQ
jgi:hypothetical protein